MKFSRIAILFGILLVEGACSHTPQKVTADTERKTYTEQQQSAAITNKAANVVGANYFTEVEFKPGSHALTAASKKEITELLNRAEMDGKIDEVMVLSWADDEYPSKARKKLSKAQLKLADKRNTSIDHYVKSQQNVDISDYNMAKQPNIFEKWFNTTDAKLKNSLAAAGLPTTASDPQYPSKASHAVVLITVK